MPIVNTLIGGSGNVGVDTFREFKLPAEFNTMSSVNAFLLPNGDVLFGANASGTTFGLWYFDSTTGETTHIVNEGIFNDFTLVPTGVLATGTTTGIGMYFIPTESKIPQHIIPTGERWIYKTVTEYGAIIGSNLINGSYYFRFSDSSLTQITTVGRNWNTFVTDGLIVMSNNQAGVGLTLSYIDELADTIELTPMDTTVINSYAGVIDCYESLDKTFVLIVSRLSNSKGVYKFEYESRTLTKVQDTIYYALNGYVGDTAILLASTNSTVKGLVEYRIDTGVATMIYNDYNYQMFCEYNNFCYVSSSTVNSKVVRYDFTTNTYEQILTNNPGSLKEMVETPQGAYYFCSSRANNLYFIDANTNYISQIWTNTNSRILSSYIITTNVSPENQMIVFGSTFNSSYGILTVRLIDRSTIYNYLTDFSGMGKFALTTDGVIIAPDVSNTSNVYYLKSDYMYQYMPQLIEEVSIFGNTTLFEDNLNVYISATNSANAKGLYKVIGTTVTKLLDYGYAYNAITEIGQKKILLSEYITYDITNEEKTDFMAWKYLYNNYGIADRGDTKMIIQDLTTSGYIVGETYLYKEVLANDNYVAVYSLFSIIVGYIGRSD